MSDPGKNWNVVTGCDKYSDGCMNCYAEDTVEWLQRMGQKVYRDNGFNLTLHEEKLDWPLKNLAKKPERPARCFVTDMGDLFHAKVPDGFIYHVFETMLKVPQHRFYVLTKRSERLGEMGPELPWAPWIWAGVTVESNKYLDRIELFTQWRYTAVMDKGTCKSCSTLDGTLFPSRDALMKAIGGSWPNPNCAGDGRCRCRAVPIYDRPSQG